MMLLSLLGTWFVFQDAAHTLSAPARWDKGDWALACAAAGTGMSLLLVDQELRDWNLQHTSQTSLAVADKLDYLGNGMWMSAGLAGVGLGAALTQHQQVADACVIGLESWLGAGLAVQLIKHTLGRARPYTQRGSLDFTGFTNDPAFMSMPSGHAAVAFGGLGGFGLASQNPWVAAGCLGLAAGVAWARVHQDLHWSSDVFWGGLIGLSVAAGVNAAHKNRKSGQGIGFESGRIIYRF